MRNQLWTIVSFCFVFFFENAGLFQLKIKPIMQAFPRGKWKIVESGTWIRHHLIWAGQSPGALIISCTLLRQWMPVISAPLGSSVSRAPLKVSTVFQLWEGREGGWPVSLQLTGIITAHIYAKINTCTHTRHAQKDPHADCPELNPCASLNCEMNPGWSPGSSPDKNHQALRDSLWNFIMNTFSLTGCPFFSHYLPLHAEKLSPRFMFYIDPNKFLQ